MQTPEPGTQEQEPVTPDPSELSEDEQLLAEKQAQIEAEAKALAEAEEGTTPEPAAPEQPEPPAPQPPAPASPDYEQKFRESTREAQVLAEAKKQRDARIAALTNQNNPTEAELRAT